MDYDAWIARERKIRAGILLSSPLVVKEQKCHVCIDCDEICLCHETTCPNCDSRRVVTRQIDGCMSVIQGGTRIRLASRFQEIEKSNM